jgi:hypothetical protein
MVYGVLLCKTPKEKPPSGGFSYISWGSRPLAGNFLLPPSGPPARSRRILRRSICQGLRLGILRRSAPVRLPPKAKAREFCLWQNSNTQKNRPNGGFFV